LVYYDKQLSELHKNVELRTRESEELNSQLIDRSVEIEFYKGQLEEYEQATTTSQKWKQLYEELKQK